MKKEILDLVKSKGILLEKEIFDVLDQFESFDAAKDFLDSLQKATGKKIITKSLLNKNYEYVSNAINALQGDTKLSVENTFVKLGITLEVTKERKIIEKPSELRKSDFEVFYNNHYSDKKIEVSDFVGHFRSRYQQLQKILMQRPDLTNLTSINKLSSNRQSCSLIGIVSEKRITKNGNLIIKFEDLTGDIPVLAKKGSDCFETANELLLDDVVGIKCSGNREMVFAYDIYFPDSFIMDKTRFDEDYCIAFVSDIHSGSKKHLGKEFNKFVDWLNSDDETAQKIKYLFFVGDNVDGVGVFPGQEKLLNLTSLKDQYNQLASYVSRVPKNITMFMCPGQHDSVRVPEPQPIIDKHYGEALYDIPNLVLVSNPSMVKLKEGEKEFKILMYHGASIHTFINEISELRLMKAHKTPAKAVKHMLKRRHLAPTHGVSASIVYVPNKDKDPLVINEVPDLLCTGEVHRLDIEKYNGTLIITGSCWQSQTDFEEKVGNVPDPCKVPIFNIKTHELKILDFSEDEN